jgi:hypothetical protein
MPPLTLPVPQPVPPLGGYVIDQVVFDVEAGQSRIYYHEVDNTGARLASGGPGSIASVLLQPAALAAWTATAGGLKAQAYAALAAQLGVIGAAVS